MRRAACVVTWAAGAAWLLATVSVVGPGASAQERDAAKGAPDPPPAAEPFNKERVQEFQRRYGQEVRQLLRAELHFLRVVTRPTKQQFEAVVHDTGAGEWAVVKTLAARMDRQDAAAACDPRAMLADAIAEAARATLPADRVALYRKELDLRTAARKRAVVSNIVESIDGVLFLTPEQRGRIDRVLSDNWSDTFYQAQFGVSALEYLPPMPGDKLLPLLTPAQQNLWRDGVREASWNGIRIDFPDDVQFPDEVWGGDPAGDRP